MRETLHRLAGGAIERLVNEALSTDPELMEGLGRLAGHRLLLKLEGTGLEVLVSLHQEGVRLSGPEGEAPEVTIRGTPLALASLASPERRRRALAEREVEISGDVNLAHAIQDLAARMEIDWEELLAHHTGDVAAHQIGRVARGTADWLRRSASVLEQDIGEYLKYEARLVVEREELKGFLDEVDELRSDTDRLEARVALLEHGKGR
ncbi:MAG: sterol-binding protein [Gammaproteobacteria bacterium]|nr:MAG: sterol-binding protein [Gammaproteobacteria bacterium]